MFLDSGRHVFASISVVSLRVIGAVTGGAAHVSRHLTGLIASVYDVYIAIPLRVESIVVKNSKGDHEERSIATASAGGNLA